MRKSFILSITSLAIMSMAIFSTPSAAVGLKEAVKLCAKNPNCKTGVLDRSGGMDLVIKNGDGTTTLVDCPGKGPCVAYAKAGPKGNEPAGGAAGNVVGVLSSGSKGTTKSGAGAPGRVTGILAPVSNPQSPKPKDPTNQPTKQGVRDHRGANGAPQGGVSVDGKPAKVTSAPKLLNYKGYDGLKGKDYGKGAPKTGATVRDHR